MLNIFQKIAKNMQESNNAELLARMSPHATIYDMYHQFSLHKRLLQQHSMALDAFNKYLQEIAKQDLCNKYTNEGQNAQQQLTDHIVLFKSLFELYTKTLKPAFNLSLLTNQTVDNYTTLPKRYRGIFTITNHSEPQLNINRTPLVIGYKKSDADKLANLLSQIQNDLSCFDKIDTTKISRNTVSNEQINIIQRLYNNFIKIASITTPYAAPNAHQNFNGAMTIYQEYLNEKSRKNSILKAYEKSQKNSQNYEQDIVNIRKKYNSLHANIINDLKSRPR